MSLESYSDGFMSKCAEFGIPESVAGGMLKEALVSTYIRNYAMPVLAGGALGAGVGAMAGKKGKRGRAALYGALSGAGAGAVGRYALSGRLINEAAGLDTAFSRLNMADRAKRIPLGLFDWTEAGRKAYNRTSSLLDKANMYLPEDQRVYNPETDSF